MTPDIVTVTAGPDRRLPPSSSSTLGGRCSTAKTPSHARARRGLPSSSTCRTMVAMAACNLPWLLLLGWLASIAWFLCDDAFISFRYARNLTEGVVGHVEPRFSGRVSTGLNDEERGVVISWPDHDAGADGCAAAD